MRGLVLLLLALGHQVPSTQAFGQASDAHAPLIPLRPIRTWLSTHAQRNEEVEGPIQTDRPSFTAAHTLVPRGWVQVETGYQFTYNRRDNVITNSYGAPQYNMRVGLAERVEWRTLWNGVEAIGARDVVSGTRDFHTTSANLQTGFKFQITEDRGLIPRSALITTLFLPTGYGSSAGDTVAPMIDYIYCWSITEIFTFTGSTGAVFAEHNGRDHNEVYQSLVFGQEWSEKWSTYWEWYVTGNDSFFRQTSGENMDGGVLWRPLPNIQFDWRAGFALNSETDNFFTGVGFSARY